MKIVSILSMLLVTQLLSSTPQRPFPQWESFPSGVNTLTTSRSVLQVEITSFYEKWKSTYLMPLSFTNGAELESGSGYVLHGETNPSVVAGLGETVSQSEAHGWAMIVMALMAGYDSRAKEYFDGFYRVFRNWQCSDHPNLMSWAIPADGDFSASRRLPSATDGDMDVAYALLLAHEQWGGESDDGFNYLDGALKVIEALEENNILYAPASHPEATYFPRLGIGTNENNPELNYWRYRATRSSDFMLGHFRAFDRARASNHSYIDGEMRGVPRVWRVLEEVTLSIIESVKHPQTGLVPDFMGNPNGDFSKDISFFPGISDEPYETPGVFDGSYWYNACRYPWRLAQGYLHDTIQEVPQLLSPLNNWILNSEYHEAWGWFQTDSIKAGYYLDGRPLETATYFDRAFVAPFMVSLSLYSNGWYLQNFWDVIGDFNEPTEWSTHYYDNTIVLLTKLLVSGNWWAPKERGTVSIVNPESNTKNRLTIDGGTGHLSISGLKPLERISLYSTNGRRLELLVADNTGTINYRNSLRGVYLLGFDGNFKPIKFR